MMEAIQSFDAGALLFIQDNIRCGALDFVMRFFSVIGNTGACWIILGAALLIPRKTRRGGFDLLLCLVVAWAVNNLALKNLVARPRPWTVIEELEIIVAPLSSFSFPSGHSCSSFASATALCLAFRGRGAWAYLPASLITISRVYVGVHYPTDILAGAVLGVLAALAVYRASHWLLKSELVVKRPD